MQTQLRAEILGILDDHRIMTVATLRPDGWPQATTVGYANDGLELFFLCGADSQKAANLSRDDRVSITIDHDAKAVMEIKGLSLAGRAIRIRDEAEEARLFELLTGKYPEYGGMAKPEPGAVAWFRVRPEVISVLDYSRGFGHTDLVEVTAKDLAGR